MWLWYLELYVFTLVAFGLGTLAGLLVVRLVVRRRHDDPAPATDPPPSQADAPVQPAEVAP